jgi:iron complex outermembrane receptor protein
VQAQLSTYLSDYKNRIVTAADLDPASPTFGSTLDRNVGDARAYGLDGQISYKPVWVQGLSLYAYASYLHSRLLQDVLGTASSTIAGGAPNPACLPGTIVGANCQIIAVHTKGAEFTETPKWSWGGRVQQDWGPFSFSAQFKHTGARWSSDDNGQGGGSLCPAGSSSIALPIDCNGRTHPYNIVDLDWLIRLKQFGLPATLRFNVDNLFNTYYFGSINTQNTVSAGTLRWAVGSPRTAQATLTLNF